MSTPSTPQRRTWAGFVLMVVPADDLETDVRPALREAADRIAADPELGETVRLALGPEVTGRADGEPAAVARRLLDTAVRGDGVIAPIVVFGILVAGTRPGRAIKIANALTDTRTMRRLRAHQFGLDTAETPFTAERVLAAVERLRDQHVSWPDAAVTDDEVKALLYPPTPAPTRSSGPARIEASPLEASPLEAPPVEARPDDSGPGVWANAVGRVRAVLPRAAPKPRESMDRMARADGVPLVYFAFAPDLQPVSRTTRKRRRELLLEIDAGFARAQAGFQVAVLTDGAARSAFVPAGTLGRRDVPKVPVSDFDLAARVGDVLATRERDLDSLRRRGSAVTRTDVVLLSTSAPLADIDAVERFRELCAETRVSWVLMDADTTLLSEEFSAAGAVILVDHPDVVNTLLYEALRIDEEKPQEVDG